MVGKYAYTKQKIYKAMCRLSKQANFLTQVKILLKVLQSRAIRRSNFQKSSRLQGQIGNLRWNTERASGVFFCIIDYSKAFVLSVPESRLMGIPEHSHILLRTLYYEQETIVRTETKRSRIGKGVNEGCTLFHIICSAYSRNRRMARLDKMIA